VLREGCLFGHIELPAFEDMTDSYSRHRLPVGPTLRLAEQHVDEIGASEP